MVHGLTAKVICRDYSETSPQWKIRKKGNKYEASESKTNGTTISKRRHIVHNDVMNSKSKIQAKYNNKKVTKNVHSREMGVCRITREASVAACKGNGVQKVVVNVSLQSIRCRAYKHYLSDNIAVLDNYIDIMAVVAGEG